MLEVAYTDFGGQYRAPNVTTASAGMLLTVYDRQHVFLLHGLNFICLDPAKSKIQFNMWIFFLPAKLFSKLIVNI